MNRSHAASQVATACGYFWPSGEDLHRSIMFLSDGTSPYTEHLTRPSGLRDQEEPRPVALCDRRRKEAADLGRPKRGDRDGPVRACEPATAPGTQWALAASGLGEQARPRRRRRRATTKRPHGVRHLMAGYDLSADRLYGHVVPRKGRTEFLAFCRYLRFLHPAEVRIAIVLDDFSPHLSRLPRRGLGGGQQRGR